MDNSGLPRGIFCVDPGETTGVAWGIFDIRADTVIEGMRGRLHAGSASIFSGKVEKGRDLVGVLRDQVSEIADLYSAFVSDYMTYHDKVGTSGLDFVCEHFVLTAGRHRPGITGIIPAYILGGIFERFDAEDIILQTAGEGMKWHKRPLHTKYNTWIVGHEHEREAWAHVAARMHKIIR